MRNKVASGYIGITLSKTFMGSPESEIFSALYKEMEP